MVSKAGTILVTTDGAALTRESQFAGTRRIGAALVRAAALQTEKLVGDGTSTTVLLANALVDQIGLRTANSEWNPVSVVREIQEATEVAIAWIQNASMSADRASLDRVAMMATHEDAMLAEKVVEAVLAVGEEGSVVISPYEGTDIVLEHKEGLLLDQGWASYAMAPKDGGIEREMDGPLVAVFRRPLMKVGDIAPAMEQASQWPGRGLVVFAPRILGDALSTLIVNDKNNVISAIAVEYSGSPRDQDDWLEDVACVTNATIADPAVGHDLSQFEAPWLGYARRILVSKKKTLVVSYLDEEILERIEARASELKLRAESSDHLFDRDRLTQRASALDGGLCTLRVGGHTNQEGQDRRSRVEDALLAVQTCLRGGVVAGAGMTYFGASCALPHTEGGKILKHTLRSILGTLAYRAGEDPEVVLSHTEGHFERDTSGWTGFDPVLKVWRDFAADPKIVDPTEVLIVALRNAVSVSCQIALSGAVIIRPTPKTRPIRRLV